MFYKANIDKSQFDVTKDKELPAQRHQRRKGRDTPRSHCWFILIHADTDKQCISVTQNYRPQKHLPNFNSSAFSMNPKAFPNFLPVSPCENCNRQPGFKPIQFDPPPACEPPLTSLLARSLLPFAFPSTRPRSSTHPN